MDNFYLGQIVLFAGAYAPEGFLPCDGRAISVNSNQALFALIGTTYGGNGVTTFGLPDLRGRLPVGAGQGVTDPKNGAGAPLANYGQGQTAGVESVALTIAQIPQHTHTLYTVNAPATSNTPQNNLLANVPADTAYYIADHPGGPTPVTVALGNSAVSPTGSGLPHANLMPTMPLNYLICTQGIFPSFQ